MSLATKKMTKRYNRNKEQDSQKAAEDEEIDLFSRDRKFDVVMCPESVESAFNRYSYSEKEDQSYDKAFR